MTKSPKQRFLKSKALAERVDAFLTSAEFQSAADAAMLQMIADLDFPAGQEGAAATSHRIAGAKSFLEKLQSIGEHPKPPPRKRIGDNLSQNQ